MAPPNKPGVTGMGLCVVCHPALLRALRSRPAAAEGVVVAAELLPGCSVGAPAASSS